MVNEAALLLSEDVARLASDIDVAMVYGFGFSPMGGGNNLIAAHRSVMAWLAMPKLLAGVEGPRAISVKFGLQP